MTFFRSRVLGWHAMVLLLGLVACGGGGSGTAEPFAAAKAPAVGAPASSPDASSPLDSLRFGDTTSEVAHQAIATAVRRGLGALGQPMQQFLPLDTPGPYGGEMSFTMAVDSMAQNYLTLKLWGEDYNENGRHVLECEGQEVEVRRMPVIDQWDKVVQSQFWLRTVALPLHLTRGRTQVRLRLRSMGLINPYAALQYSTYQANMNRPSQPIYGAWVHTTAVQNSRRSGLRRPCFIGA